MLRRGCRRIRADLHHRRQLGGSHVSLAALLLSPATPSDADKRRKPGERGPSGSGVYPALAKLGISDRATPALREAVAHQFAASNSADATRVALERQGILIDHKAALRYAYSFANAALEARTHAFATGGPSPDVADVAGMRIVVSLDGGRVRLKEVAENRDVQDRTYDAQWREPKILTIYKIDQHGRRDRKVKAVIDGTLGTADDVAALLIGHLRLVGAQNAEHVRFTADGGSWIWNRTDEIRKAVGIPRERWSEQLDLYHAVEYLGRLIKPLSPDRIDRGTWLAEAKLNLLTGDLDELLVAIRSLPKHDDLKVDAALAYFEKHRERLDLMFSRPDGQPMGSGAVESAVRRVINLRLKGNGIFWLREHAECVIHLRAHLLAGRWSELVKRTLNRPAWMPRSRTA